MTEPALQTATVVVAAPALALLFTLWPFALAFVAGCIALMYLTKMTTLNSVKSVIASTFLGGALSQLTAGIIIHVLSSFNSGIAVWGKEPDSKLLTIATLAILIGLFIQHLMPKLFNRLGSEVKGK